VIGVAGTTGFSLNRRLLDARFSNRWLVGRGLDIGGGSDSLALYASLFPRIASVTVYDQEQGDAQYLRNVQDDSFDFVYSAHCLEHMVDPRIAIRHWLRVVRPGGHLVITVPDEDLYEQGVWPSTFNDDHKHTFTVFKQTSWSPVSINILDLLRGFDSEVSIAKIERLDHSFLHGFERFDQTRLPFPECGIEFVLQKV
jgi:SAM-dependent methyltransferase